MEESEAILIRRIAWSDNSLITVWLTESHGKLRLMARSARRPQSPFSGKLDLFFRGEIGFATNRKSSLGTLREVHLLAPFDGGTVPCANVFLCGYFAELIDLCTQEGQPVPELFDLLKRAVEHLRETAASLRALEHFEREMARVLGVGDDGRHPLAAIEAYCGRIPASRAAATGLLVG